MSCRTSLRRLPSCGTRISASRACALALALLAFVLTPASAAVELTEIRLQLKWFHQFQFAGYYAAIEQGFFREAGLDVKLLEGGPNIVPTDVVLAGAAEFGIGTSGLLVSRSRGRPIVAVAAVFQHSPYILLARDEPGVHGIRDLAGRRIMVEPYAEELIAYLRQEGLAIEDIIAVEHSGDPLMMAGGDIIAMTAYTTTEPFILDRAGITYRKFDPKVAGIDFYGDTLFTTETFAREHEHIVIAFRDAVIRGWRYALRNQDEVIDLIHREYGSELTREHERFAADEIRRLLIPDLIEIGYMNRARWEHIAAEFSAAGLLEREVDLDHFLFEPTVRLDWTWVYVTLLAAGALIAIAMLALAKFYTLNRSLQAEVERRRELEAKLKNLAITDPGTGVLNRRGFLAAIRQELECAQPEHRPLALLILDVDRFKHINDTYGHAAGDHVLVELASRCRQMMRAGDIIGRLGGEEFAVVMPAGELDAARRLAERVRAACERVPVRLPKGETINVTASIGLAMLQQGESLEQFMSRADGAMYEAKCLGRNRVVVAADVHQTARLMLRRRFRREAGSPPKGSTQTAKTTVP